MDLNKRPLSTPGPEPRTNQTRSNPNFFNFSVAPRFSRPLTPTSHKACKTTVLHSTVRYLRRHIIPSCLPVQHIIHTHPTQRAKFLCCRLCFLLLQSTPFLPPPETCHFYLPSYRPRPGKERKNSRIIYPCSRLCLGLIIVLFALPKTRGKEKKKCPFHSLPSVPYFFSYPAYPISSEVDIGFLKGLSAPRCNCYISPLGAESQLEQTQNFRYRYPVFPRSSSIQQPR